MGPEGAAAGAARHVPDDDAHRQSFALRPLCRRDGLRARRQSDGGVLHKDWGVQTSDKGVRANRPLFGRVRRRLRCGHVTHRDYIEGRHVEAISYKE